MKETNLKKDKSWQPSLLKGFPLYGWLGVAMALLFWAGNWGLNGLRTHLLFFPMWLGYILTMDALSYQRKKRSLLTRSWRLWLFLFVLSIPFWWLFEWLNGFVNYWSYHPREAFTHLEFALLSSLSFSTVVPAMFATAEWVGSYSWIKRFSHGPKIGRRRSVQILFFLLGIGMIGCVFLFPQYAPAFLWMSLFFLLDPLNCWLGYKAILNETAGGDWRTVAALWIGALICGFFWEMWNYYAWPKWEYHLPFADFWHVFEMPLLGYLGYLPFSLELYVVYQFLAGILKRRSMQDYPHIIEERQGKR